jgi:hypothetical protein
VGKVMRSEKCEQFLKHNDVNCCTTISPDDEGSFSRSGCDCCQTGLANTVYECHGFNPKTREVVELGDVCHECLCYFANGDDSEIEGGSNE